MSRKKFEPTLECPGPLVLEKASFEQVVQAALNMGLQGPGVFQLPGWLEGLRLVGPHDVLASDLDPAVVIELTASDVLRKDWKLFSVRDRSSQDKARMLSLMQGKTEKAAASGKSEKPAPRKFRDLDLSAEAKRLANEALASELMREAGNEPDSSDLKSGVEKPQPPADNRGQHEGDRDRDDDDHSTGNA